MSSLYSVKDRDRALVGRLRPDARDKSRRTVCLTVVGDNLRLGAATNAVRAASRWFKSSDPELRWRKSQAGLEDVFIHLMEGAQETVQ